MADFLISDNHEGHGNIIRYCNRDFLPPDLKELVAQDVKFKVPSECVHAMNEHMLDCINRTVGPDDTLYHLGDVGFGSAERIIQWRNRILCRNIVLIRGNHDSAGIIPAFSACHKDLYTVLEGLPVYLHHWPQPEWEGMADGRVMCHGHVHGKGPTEPYLQGVYGKYPICDVGVDGPDLTRPWGRKYYPWSIPQLREYLHL